MTLGIEALCDSYLRALAAGEPAVLSAAEMGAVAERFRAYGQLRDAEG